MIKYLKANRNDQKKYIFVLVFIIEVLMIINCVVILLRPLSKYEYRGKDLIAPKAIFLEQFLGESRDGYYIDNSLISEGEKLQEYRIENPKTDLKKGSYEISIGYSTGTNVNVYTADSESGYYHVKMGRQNIGLDPGKNECTFSLESDSDIEGYAIEIKFSGENYIFVDKISISETPFAKIKNLITTVFIILLLNYICVVYVNRKEVFNKKNLIVLTLLAAIIVLASVPAFAPYLYAGHDLEFHLNRIEGMKNAILAGQIPVRIHNSTLGGAGYPVSIFYGNLMLYFPAILRILGWSVQSAYQGYVLMVNIISCLIMYKVLLKIFKSEWIGLFGSFIYMMAPYRLECVYLRAAVGEYTAMCFYPLIIYGLYQIYTKNKNEKNYGWLYFSIGFSGLILSHVISTFIAFFLTLLFCIVNLKSTLRKDIFGELCKAVFTTIGMCSWFIIPFADYMLSGVKATSVVNEGFFEGRTLALNQLLSIFPHATGEAYSFQFEVNMDLEMTYAMGGALIMAPIIYIIYFLNRKKYGEKVEKLGDMTFIFSLLALLMTTAYFPWNEMEHLGEVARFIMYNIQFPWRFLGIASVLLVFELSVAVNWMRENSSIFYNIVICLCVLAYVSGNYFMTEYMNNAEKRYVVDQVDVDNNNIGAAEYMPEGAVFRYKDVWHDEKNVLIVTNQSVKNTYLVECANLTSEMQYIQIPMIYYKNYRAVDDMTGTELRVESGEECRIRVELPQRYSGIIRIEYRPPWYWRLSEIISLGFLMGLGTNILRKKKKCVKM